MTAYTPFASLLLAECLATDPFGTLHRGIDRSGHAAGQNVLVRRYHPYWLEAGLLAHPADIRRNLIHLGHLKLFQGARLDLEESPHFIWPLCPGRSLPVVLEAARTQHIPFGLDSSLFLAWVLCQHVSQLHRAGLPLGFLSPHRVWVGFDGLVELLDTPVIAHLEALLPIQPEVREATRPYLQGPRQEGIVRDAYQVGALLFEILAHRPLPEARFIGRELGQLAVDTQDGPEPLPPSIREMLARLLGMARPFRNLEELEKELEEALFGNGDFNPTTFDLAFSMHTLFRFEIEAEQRALEEERTGGLITFQSIQRGAPASATAGRSGKKRTRIVLPAAAVLLGVAGFAAWSIHARQPLAPQPTVQVIPPPKAASRPEAPRPAAPAAPIPALPAPRPEEPHVAPKPVTPPAPIPTVSETPVKLRVFVDEQGRVRQTYLVEGAAPGSHLETAAFNAARELRLSPALEGGVPIRQWREITVRVK